MKHLTPAEPLEQERSAADGEPTPAPAAPGEPAPGPAADGPQPTPPPAVMLLAMGEGAETRVPVLGCRDLLAATIPTQLRGATDTEEVDAALASAREVDAAVVVAGPDGAFRAVARRMARAQALPAGSRPDGLPGHRTMRDLPAMALLPMDTPPDELDLASRLRLPRAPEEVARAVTEGRRRRLDLLRSDAGTITLGHCVVGGIDEQRRPVVWSGHVEVDNTPLADPRDAVAAVAVVNAGGYWSFGNVELVSEADPADGQVDVSVAVAVGGQRPRLEVRRTRGRAVAVITDAVPVLDDSVQGSMQRRRNWWVEHAAWSVYTL